ncbi:hypothetical protein O9993_07160 [Vibrio lentus]|nr:hypothetical protein [Vibrio lentus]
MGIAGTNGTSIECQQRFFGNLAFAISHNNTGKKQSISIVSPNEGSQLRKIETAFGFELLRTDYTANKIAWLHFCGTVCILPLPLYYIAAIFHTHFCEGFKKDLPSRKDGASMTNPNIFTVSRLNSEVRLLLKTKWE